MVCLVFVQPRSYSHPLLTVSLYSRFHWPWVLLYVAFTAVEVLSIFNSAFTSAPNWTLLGKSDVALVTGGLGGLGLEIVKRLLFDHNVGKVIILDIHKPQFEFDFRVEYCHCDIECENTLKSAVESTIRKLRQQNQHISVLVSNAGVRYSGPLLNMKEEHIRRLFSVNTFAQITLFRKVIRNHIKFYRQKQLSVVTVSSILGALGPKNLLVYSASKAATTQIHECLAEELRPYRNINMLLVTPGQLTTDMFRDILPSRTFFAPMVNHIALAQAIVEKINKGESGTLCEPFYTNFLPAVKVLPSIVQFWCRRFSSMDEKIPGSSYIH